MTHHLSLAECDEEDVVVLKRHQHHYIVMKKRFYTIERLLGLISFTCLTGVIMLIAYEMITGNINGAIIVIEVFLLALWFPTKNIAFNYKEDKS